MKKPASKNSFSHVKAGILPDKQNGKPNPIDMVELRSQIISDYNQSIRTFNESHKH